MSEAVLQRFNCAGCEKSYPWKPELSKKRVKCKCGAVMTVPDLTPPQSEDDPPALPDDDIFAMIDSAPTGISQGEAMLAAAAAAPSPPKVKAKATAVAGPARGNTKNVLGYRQGPSQAQRQRAGLETMHDLKRDVYLPAGLVAGSFCAYLGWIFIHHAAAGGSTVVAYGTGMFILMALKTILMIGGAFIVAPLAGVSFGPFWTAILKLAAVTIAPDVFATILEESIGVPGAGLIAGAIALALYWGLMSVLFDMEAAEAWYVVVLFGVLRWILTLVLTMVLFGMLMSGSSLAAGSGYGGSAAPTATQKAMDFDESVAAMKENNLVEEGLDYIQRTNRQADLTIPIKAIYAAGAKDVSFTLSRDINGKTEPGPLAIQWPRDEKKRAAVLAAINKMLVDRAAALEKEHPDWGKITPRKVTDEGGKYVEVDVGAS